VTDQNGCTGTSSTSYLRCSTGCSGVVCTSTPPVCNGILNASSGYNNDAIINFLVPANVYQVALKLNPLSAPQSYSIYHNTDNIVNVGNIYTPFPNTQRNNCQMNGISILNSVEGAEIYDTISSSYTGLYRSGNFASKTFAILPGDILTIDINHPSCITATHWIFQILCNGAGSIPILNSDEQVEQESYNELTETNEFSSDLMKAPYRFYPNPFSKGINLELSSEISEKVTIQAYNNVGHLLFEKQIDVIKGTNLRYIEDFEQVPNGVITVKLKSPTQEHTTRVIRIN